MASGKPADHFSGANWNFPEKSPGWSSHNEGQSLSRPADAVYTRKISQSKPLRHVAVLNAHAIDVEHTACPYLAEDFRNDRQESANTFREVRHAA